MRSKRFNMKLLNLICAAVLLIAVLCVWGADGDVRKIYVTPNAPKETEGASWTSPTTLEYAFSIAGSQNLSADVEIYCLSGDYSSVTVKSPGVNVAEHNVSIYGGCSEETASSSDVRSGKSIFPNSGTLYVEATFASTTGGDAAGSAIIDGVEFKGRQSAGSALDNSEDTSLTLKNCVFQDCDATDASPVVNKGAMTVERCRFENNTATFSKNAGIAGAVYSSTSKPVTISNSSFISNKVVGGNGGAIYSAPLSAEATFTIQNCVFDGNQATTGDGTDGFSGGAVYSNANAALVINGCTFRNNTAATSGDAVAYNTSLSSKRSGISRGAGVTTTSITNSIFMRAAGSTKASVYGIDDGSITYSMFDAADTSGSASSTNIHAADFKMQWNATGGYFELLAGSPAIDAGTADGAASMDIRGVSRPQGKAYDIGCYEYVFPAADNTTTVAVSSEVIAKIEAGEGDVRIALGFDGGPDAVSLDGYQSVKAVASPDLITVSKVSPSDLPPCALTFEYTGSTMTLNTNSLVSVDKKALLPVTITVPLTRANIATVVEEAQKRGSGTMDVDAVLADPASYADRLFLALRMQKQIIEPAGTVKCTALIPIVMGASDAINRGILSLAKNDAGGLTATMRFYMADDAGGARVDAATGNIIVGDGEENRQIKDPLWATYKAASTGESGSDGGSGCSSGIPAALILPSLLLLAGFRRRKNQ